MFQLKAPGDIFELLQMHGEIGLIVTNYFTQINIIFITMV